MSKQGTAFKKTILDNGIRVLTERHPESRAVSIGIWVLTGTRDEKPEMAGVSHFLEHMVFKGTKTRSPFQIAKSLEQLGGELNAYTSREYTCYHAYVLKDHWDQALDVLSDLVCNMKIEPKEFKLEKGVILQEIAMSDDNQEDIIYDIFFDKVYGKHPLGRPILGTPKSIATMNSKQIMDYYKKFYTGPNIIVSIAGNIEHDQFIKAVNKKLGKKSNKDVGVTRKAPGWNPVRFVQQKQQGEQTHLLVGMPTASFKDKYRFEAFIVNTLLGGGMTSRLYQSVREKKGLVYAIHSSLHTNVDSGLLLIYAGTESKNLRKVGDIIAKEISRLKKQGVRKSDVNMFKTQVTGSIVLGSDDLENRMTSLAVNEMVFGKYKPVDTVIDEINAVTVDTVNEFIQTRMDTSQFAGVLIGPDVDSHKSWFESLSFEK